jgi:hypothetical protein
MARWFAFAFTMLGTWILTNTNTDYFSLGWGISAISTSLWAYFAYQDRDIRGFINFY